MRGGGGGGGGGGRGGEEESGVECWKKDREARQVVAMATPDVTSRPPRASSSRRSPRDRNDVVRISLLS